MNPIFGLEYSKIYDLLYDEKDYQGESLYIRDLIDKFTSIEVEKILELGCGSGGHAIQFLKMGNSVFGLDLSEQMIKKANLNCSNYERFESKVSDIRDFDLGLKFDVVLSLFHVMSYQTNNQDLDRSIANARKHLKKNGLFIFDFWYGPAVLGDRPKVKVKELETENAIIVRETKPEIKVNKNLVEVFFNVKIKLKDSGIEETFQEQHSIRYFFLPELEYFLTKNSFKPLQSFSWMSREIPGDRSWYVSMVARAI